MHFGYCKVKIEVAVIGLSDMEFNSACQSGQSVSKYILLLDVFENHKLSRRHRHHHYVITVP